MPENSLKKVSCLAPDRSLISRPLPPMMVPLMRRKILLIRILLKKAKVNLEVVFIKVTAQGKSTARIDRESLSRRISTMTLIKRTCPRPLQCTVIGIRTFNLTRSSDQKGSLENSTAPL
jgi:hypothetical protein